MAAKREASTQLIKDGSMSDEDGFSVGAQMAGAQRATAAQMASRRLAKPRGGRRPGTPGQSRVIHHAAPTTGFTQTQPSMFIPNNTNSPNGVQQPNGNQASQTSQSFPPFGSGSNTGSGFTFSGGQPESVNNPFANVPPPQSYGFEGSIFSMPAPQKLSKYAKQSEGEQKPLFAAHSPFHNSNQDNSTPNQSQTSDNPFGMMINQNQQQPSQTASSLFLQPNAQQQQQASSIFTAQQPAKTTADLFAHLRRQPESQTPSTPFGQGTSIFQQPQATPSTSNIFAHLGTPQPSLNFPQTPTSTAQEDQTMMSTSPDYSPQGKGVGVFNESNLQPQSSPTKDATASGTGKSLFDRVSKSTDESSLQPPLKSRQDTAAQASGPSLFENITKPATEASIQAPSNATETTTSQLGASLFNMAQKPTTASNTPPPSAHDSSSLFKMPQASSFPDVFKSPAESSQPAKKKLFGQNLSPGAPLPSSQPSIFSLAKTSDSRSVPGTSNPSSSSLVTQNTSSMIQEAPSTKRKFGTPPAPQDDFTEEEKRQTVTGYRLKALDTGMRKRVRANPSEEDLKLLKKYYAKRVEAIHAANGGPLEGPVPGSKRKAADEQHKDEAQGKKARSESSQQFSPGTLSNGTGPGSSQTSSIFKNILGNKSQDTAVNGTASAKPAFSSSNLLNSPSLSSSNGTSTPSLFQPKLPSTSSMPPPPKPVTESPFKGFAPATQLSSVSSTPNLFAVPKNTSDVAPSTPPQPPPFKVPAFGANPSSDPPSPIRFFAESSTSNEPSSDVTKASAFKAPSLGANTSSASEGSHPFAIKPTISSETSFNATTVPALKVPTFGASTSSTSGDSSPFTVKPTASGETSSNAPKAPVFKVPSFGGGAPGNFMAQFGQVAGKAAAEVKKKRKAEDFDPEEETEEDWECRDAEQQRAKKQKTAEEGQKTYQVVNGKMAWVTASGKETTGTNTPEEKAPSVFDQPQMPMTNGNNIFAHLSGEESGADGSKTGDADDEDDEDAEEDGEEDKEDQPQAKTQEASSNPFEARVSRSTSPQRNTPSPSMFDRITRDENGDPVREIPKPDAKSSAKASGSFGDFSVGFGSQSASRFSTSNHFGQPASQPLNSTNDKPSSTPKIDLFGKLPSSTPSQNAFGKLPSFGSPLHITKTSESPKGDNTWKADSPIKFGAESNPPAVNVTSPSPSKSPFGGLFGALPKTNTTAEAQAKPTSSLFSTTPTKAPSTGLGFNFTPANPVTKSLALPSNTASGATSRATSPGATTGESANESATEGDGGHFPKEDQVDLTSGGPGEEDEDVLFNVKAKAMCYDAEKKAWITKGVGPLRVMKNRNTGNTRILMRQDPSGRIVLNASLVQGFEYKGSQDRTVSVPIADETGKVNSWKLRVGKEDDLKKLASILSENRPS